MTSSDAEVIPAETSDVTSVDATDVGSAEAADVATAEAADVATAEAADVATAEAADVAAAKAADVTSAKAATTVSATAAAAGLCTAGNKAAGKQRACQDHYQSSSHDISPLGLADVPPQRLHQMSARLSETNANVALVGRWEFSPAVSIKFSFNIRQHSNQK
jgi:hypothetical protein